MSTSKALVVILFVLVTITQAEVITIDPGGTWPVEAMFSLDDQYAYVACYDEIVTIVRLSDYQVIDTIPIGNNPISMSMTPDGQYLYLPNAPNPFSTAKVDIAARQIIDTIPGGTDPAFVDFTPDGVLALISCHWSSILQFVSVETGEEVDRLNGIGNGGYDVAVTPNGEHAFIVIRSSGPNPDSGVYKIDMTSHTILDTIPIKGGEGIAITPDGSEVWVPGNKHNNLVYVIDATTNDVITTIPVGDCPYDVAISPTSDYAYVTLPGDNAVCKIDMNTYSLAGAAIVGESPRQVNVSSDGTKVLVTNQLGNTVSLLHPDDFTYDLWSDDFESYTVDQFPNSNWLPWHNCSSDPSNNIVVNTQSNSGDKSLQVYGSHYGCWSATAVHMLDSLPQQILICADLMASGESGSGACGHSDIGLHLIHQTQAADDYNFLSLNFRDVLSIDLGIRGIGTISLQSYEVNQWYGVALEIDTLQKTVKVWIDTVSYGPYSWSEAYLSHPLKEYRGVATTSMDGMGWADDVSVYGMFSEDIDSLYVSGSDYEVITDEIIVPLKLKCQTPTNGFDIPITWGSVDLILDSISFVGTAVEDWIPIIDSVNNDSNKVHIGRAVSESGSYILEGEDVVLAYLHFDRPVVSCGIIDTLCIDDPEPESCDSFEIIIDTTYFNGQNLLFSDTLSNGFQPVIDFDTVAAPNAVLADYETYMPGDCKLDQLLNLLDITTLISYLYKDGIAPAPMNSGDANGDCVINLLDLTYLIANIYKGGPEPLCGCVGEGTFKNVPLSYDGKIATTYSEGKTIITVSTPIDLMGIELELRSADGKTVSLRNKCDGADLFHSQSENTIKAGIVDPIGRAMIPSGERVILEVDGEVTIAHALASDESANAVYLEVVNGEDNDLLPKQFTLSQNHPNPFNPVTSISFSLPDACNVSLEIYNIMGQRVETLINDFREAGEYTIEWDGSDFASGVYLYRLRAGEFTETKKMTLLK